MSAAINSNSAINAEFLQQGKTKKRQPQFWKLKVPELPQSLNLVCWCQRTVVVACKRKINPISHKMSGGFGYVWKKEKSLNKKEWHVKIKLKIYNNPRYSS
jgi:hypothetical protein